MKPFFYIHENSVYHKQLAYKVLFHLLQWSISVAPIAQVTYVRNKNSNIQGRSLNAIKMIFHSIGTAHKGNIFSFGNFGCVLSRDFFRWQFQ